jgi:hypothetical protein
MSIVLGKISALPSDAAIGDERQSPLLREHVSAFDRPLSLEALAEVIDECKREFTDPETGLAQRRSDIWLAPRLHAALRITKREAAMQEVWMYLAAYAFPDYVSWRWGRARQAALSVSTDVKKHPFKRLWWGAEMFRNGESYEAVERAYARSDVPNTSLSTRIMNNKAVALAALRFLDKHQMTSRQVNPVSTQLRTAAVTVALDFACPNLSDSLEIDWEWLESEPQGFDVIRTPVGPKHGFVGEEEIERAEEMLDRVIDTNRVRAYRRDQPEGSDQDGL